jgi:predicted GNAT family acetyltransferase
VPVETHRFDSVDAFLDVAGPFLEAREPEHMLSLGILGERRAQDSWPDDGVLVAAQVDGHVVATAIWTRPWNVVLSEIDEPRAIDALADAFAGDGLGGVHAPEEHAEAFARAWTARAGGTYRSSTSQRSYALDAVTPPADVPGSIRRARVEDRDLLVGWMIGFDEEAMGSESGRQYMVELVDAMLTSPTRTGYLWEVEGTPVSMCQAVGATPHGIRIGAVYTPPEHRRRGYASAIAAAVSQEHLDRGRRWCFLFTDRANPTSNRIYQAIGYRPIRDVQLIRFDRS